MPLMTDLLLIIGGALIGGLIAQRLRLPLLLGYTAAGIAVGPYTAGPTVSELLHIELLAEIGVALFLFAVGVEFSFKMLAPLRASVLPGLLLSLLLTLAYGFCLGLILGWEWQPSLWFGAIIALSSAIVTLKALENLDILDLPARQTIRGYLIVQNLLVIPLILVLRELAGPATAPYRLGLATAEGLLLLAVLVVSGMWLVPRVLRLAGPSLPDLQALIVVTSAVAIGAGVYWYGLPFVFVAFAIGMALSESDLTRQPLSELIQLRDLFGVIFFVSAGMLLNLPFLVANLGDVVIVTMLVAAGKGMLIGWVMHLSGVGRMTALVATLGLFQVGELSLILAQVGLSNDLLDDRQFSVVTVMALLTMIATPLVLRSADPLLLGLRGGASS
jgi:monovalent cation:H+ antiporter-2, CPA2 family